MISTIRSVLASNPWFAQLPPELADAILTLGRVKQFTNGAVFASTDRANGLYALLSGEVMHANVSPSGKLSDVRFARPGHWFGVVAALDSRPYGYDAHAIGSATLFHLRAEALAEVVAGRADRLLPFTQLVCRRLRTAMDYLSTMRSQSSLGLLARHLMFLASVHGEIAEDGVRINLHLSQEKLAAMTGIGRQRLNRHLKTLAAMGAVRVGYANITIGKAQLLNHLAGETACSGEFSYDPR